MSGGDRRFHGGLRLDGAKDATSNRPSAPLPLPARLVLPLQQHIGEPAEPVVKAGARVLKGQVLARPRGYVSVPLHAPTSGTVVEIADHPVPHPSGLSAPCVVLDPDGAERWVERAPLDDFESAAPADLRARIRDAGLVGMGGAGFPTFIKLSPGPARPVDTLILNGVECEPHITCDDRLMRERPGEVVGGARVLGRALGAVRCIVGVEDNKPQAIAALRAAAGGAVEVVAVPTRYPAGDERLLIAALTGREVPSAGLPADVGVVMQNVATAAAAYRAVVRGEPLVSRLVTVTGGAVPNPANLEVLLGTAMHDLLAHCGAEPEGIKRLVVGGPMMGFAARATRLPVTKTVNCLLAPAAAELPAPGPALPCIRCGACVDACPVYLLPQQLYWHARARDLDKVQDYHVFDCIECGCCAWVCPSRIPLVQYYRFAKTEIWAAERERDKADLARSRHEFRLERLEREKRERAAKLKQKKRALGEPAQAADGKKAAIEAALERARARRDAEEGEAGEGPEAAAGEAAERP